MLPTAELLEVATDAAALTVDLLLERIGSDLSVVEKSTSTDLVTQVDREAERLIVDRITASRPDDGIIAEEGTNVEGSSGVTWIIDPIDGTTNFVYGHPGFGVSIAAEFHGEPVVGVVGDPLNGETFTASRGGGAYRNGKPIAVSATTDPNRMLVATGFGYEPERRRAQGELVARLLADIGDIRRMGSAAVDLCSVACGRVDAYFESGLNRWDFAAGAIIAAEAGAVVSDLHGGEPSRAFVFAASPAVAPALRDLLRHLDADQI